MLRIAVLGADGAGKSTVTARLAAELPYPLRRMYLGVGAESATHALPTTRAVRRIRAATGHAPAQSGPPPIRATAPTAPTTRTATRPVRWAKGAGAAGRVANRITEEAYQEVLAKQVTGDEKKSSLLEKITRQVNLKQLQIYDLYVHKEWPVKKVTATLNVNIGQVYLAKHRISGLLKKELKKLVRK